METTPQTRSYKRSYRYQSSNEFVFRRRFLIELALKQDTLHPEVRAAATLFLESGQGCPAGFLHRFTGIPGYGELNDVLAVFLEDVPARQWGDFHVRHRYKLVVGALRRAGVLPEEPPLLQEDDKWKRPGGTLTGSRPTKDPSLCDSRFPIDLQEASIEPLRMARVILLHRALRLEPLSFDVRNAVMSYLGSGELPPEIHYNPAEHTLEDRATIDVLFYACRPKIPRENSRNFLLTLQKLILQFDVI